MIVTLFLTPLIGSLLLFLSPDKRGFHHQIAFFTSGLAFIQSIWIWLSLSNFQDSFQFVESFELLKILGSYPSFGIDGLSIVFILLTCFLIPLCLLLGIPLENFKSYAIIFLIMETLMIGVFIQIDLFYFYIFFESVLIPMFLIIGIWGSRERKIRASYQFFLYTLIGSLFMLIGIFILSFEIGSTHLDCLYANAHGLSPSRQILLWCAFFASFAVKLPIIPVHLWLPEAHVEAPTAGSVILAGVLLKMGGYGLIRFSLPLFPYACAYMTPLVLTLSLISLIYASLTCFRQIDLKKIIAYSSVAHMSFVTLGIFSGNLEGLEGSILLMVSHALVSSGLFICIGILYERYKTRLIHYYGGCAHLMPLFSSFLVLFTMANISLPGTSAFIGEFMVFIGSIQTNKILTFGASLGMVLGAGYSLWLCNRVCFGPISVGITAYSDLTRREFWILFPLAIGILWLGLYPESILQTIHSSATPPLENFPNSFYV